MRTINNINDIELKVLKKLKYAKIRENSKYIQVHATYNKVRYRFSTKIPLSKANLLYVENNWQILLQEYIKTKQDLKRFQEEISIAEYGMQALKKYEGYCKISTFKRYENVFKHVCETEFGQLGIAYITKKNAEEIFYKYFDTLSIDNQKVLLCVLRFIYKQAEMQDLVVSNPFNYVRPKKEYTYKEQKNRAFSEEEMQEILSRCDGDLVMKLYCYIAFYTGMRTNEILALKKEDIDLNKGVIHVCKSVCEGQITTTKTGKERYVEILKPLTIALTHYLQFVNSNYLFEENNKLIKSSQIFYKFKKILKQMNVQNTLYATRHTFATMMCNHTNDPIWVSKQLGHANINTTVQHYITTINAKNKDNLFLNSELLYLNQEVV